jgi:HAD superfamily hydrolase (TIGR01509 family)
VLQGKGVALSEDEIIDRMTNRVLERIDIEVPWRPGSRELLQELVDLGIPTALVTMSIRRMAEQVTKSLGFSAFEVIVAGDNVTHSKPHPEPYLLAAEALGVSAADCVALEDSAPGVASAIAAGAVVIGVPMHIPLTASDDHDLWDTVDGKTANDLFELFAARRSA